VALAALASAAALAGCGGSEEPAPTTTTAVEPTAPADGDDRPRRPPVGDGRGGVSLVELGEFDQPLYVTQPAADDDLYVVEQCGRVVRVGVDGGDPRTFLDLSDRVTCGGEQGLLSIAFAPDHASSGLLYAYYTDLDGQQVVAEYRVADGGEVADPESAREVLRMDDFAANHNGGLLVFGPDRNLYIGTGDGGDAGDPQRNGQDLGSLLGKILRIDPRESGGRPYSVPDDNPHTDESDARGEVAVHGLRNPWRFSFDRETGDLWIGDVGQDALEEVDSATAASITGLDSGLNFGWSAFEGTQPYNADQEAPGARPPTLEYPNDGGCSVTGGYVVRDPELRTLYGRYLYGDYCEGALRSFTARPGRPARDDVEVGLEVSSLSSFGEDAEGRVYAVSLEGPVYRLAPEGSG
jgi:glucose/arabinose dehydrogenase